MMEQAFTFESQGQLLLSILHLPKDARDTAVLLVVGGPQYRVGSHRQFVQLSRALAKSNIASMRFDYTGMGDSTGDKSSFESVDHDIKDACDLLCQQAKVDKIVIWGLCDAASAAMMYAPSDPRIVGMVLLNPWLRSDAAMGKTMLKYYYVQRLLSADFWRKLLSGKVNVAGSVSDAKGFVKDSVADSGHSDEAYQSRMQKGVAAFNGKLCLILSGVDLTAKEFAEQTIGNKAWKKLKSQECRIHHLEKADHTFSSKVFKQQVEQLSTEFVHSL